MRYVMCKCGNRKPEIISKKCEHCDGRGKVDKFKCEVCKGKGWINERQNN